MSITTTTALCYSREKQNEDKKNIDFCNNELQKLLNINMFHKCADTIRKRQRKTAKQQQHHHHQSQVSLLTPTVATEATVERFIMNDTYNGKVVWQHNSQNINETVANLLPYEFCVETIAKNPLFGTTTILSPLLIYEQRQQHRSMPASPQKESTPTIMQKQNSSKAPSISCTNSGIKYNQRSTHTEKYCCPIFLIYNTTLISCSMLLQKRFLQLFIILLLSLSRMMTFSNALLVVEPTFIGLSSDRGVGIVNENGENVVYNSTRNNLVKTGVGDASNVGVAGTGTGSNGGSGVGISTISAALGGSGVSGIAGSSSSVGSVVAASGYLDKLDNLERSVAAVLIKVAYGTTSTTKRSIPDNGYVPSLTTMATPLLTTLRYLEKSPHQQQISLHHRNYELDLERDHALPTSAPNADILKSNSNPTYPNPNRHHNHERHHHLLNSTPSPSLPNTLKKNKGQSPTISMYPGDIPFYSPPARSFFTPPLPPEYQNPFADKPTLRGTNNEGIIANTGTYINRRPIPPPSLMPGHERIPFRPPDFAASTGGSTNGQQVPAGGSNAVPIHPGISSSSNSESERKKALNTPSRTNVSAPLQNIENKNYYDSNSNISQQETSFHSSPQHNTRQEVLPSIRRILSGSNGNKGEIPEVLLKQATSRPIVNYHQLPSSPVVIVDSTSQQNEGEYSGLVSPNINKSKNMNGGVKAEYEGGGILDISSGVNGGNVSKTKTKVYTISTDYTHDQSERNNGISGSSISSTPSAAAAISEAGAAAAAASATSTSSTINATDANNSEFSSSSPSSSSSSTAAAAATHATWTIAWNIHVYLSVILFTILAVYLLYKMLTYNKLTHLFSQSYFVCIHLILIIICASRIFYLCYDAYNIHSSFHIFVSEILLNLPATFLTISFSVLILFLFLKSLNHKNNRYSALIRPLTVVVGCGVHVVLCITLHYVESYTMQNQQHYYHQQQQLYRRQQQNHQVHHLYTPSNSLTSAMSGSSLHLIASAGSVANAPPPRVLSLICQIIYIFICLSLGLLYLYLYRILKRILRSKSQNYIHGYQNLSYAIHITIATALLFVLLAALQIFGAISISTTRPLIAQVAVEIDWLQWGYQFSLRLIEISIITLLSWVAGLKTSGGGGTVGIGNGDSHLVVGGGSGVFGSGSGAAGREKHGHHHNHSNVASFFLPCTSSSSQEQFDTDYPAVCNANTNLHTYTMRTGKLIYDDSLALNSLASGGAQSSQIGSGIGGRNGEFQLQPQLTYQRPYDTGSLHSSANHNAADYSAQGAMGNRFNHDLHQYADYLTDATTDHYENPNFDLRGSCVENSAMQKFAKTSTTSTTVSSSGDSGSSAASQQQKLLLQSDSCYSEPLQPNCNSSSNYDFNNFERPKINVGSGTNNNQLALECWSVPNSQPITRIVDKRDTKSHTTLERSAYENPERRSSNSTYSCASSSGGGGRYASYNSFERGHYNGVRKSGTLNNIVGGSNSIMHIRNSSSSSAASSNVSTAAQRASGVQTLALADRHHHAQQQYHSQRGSNRVIGRGIASGGSTVVHDHGIVFGLSSLDRANSQITQQEQQQNSDDDMMLSDSNVERTNLINTEDGSCITNSNRIAPGGNVKDQGLSTNSAISSERLNISKAAQSQINSHSNIDGNQIPNHHQHDNITPGPVLGTSINSNSGASSSASESATSGSMLVAEHGFVRFRALDDINNAQGVGIHNASIRNQNRNNVSSTTNTLNAAIVSS